MGLAWAPDVDGAGPDLDLLEMAPVFPVEGRMTSLLGGMVMAEAAATAAAVAFSSLSLLIRTFLL